MPQTTTPSTAPPAVWNDGWDVIHVRVPIGAPDPEATAREALRAALTGANEDGDSECWLFPRRVPFLDDATGIVYRQFDEEVDGDRV